MASHDSTTPAVSFRHVLNPFPARPGTEHAIASRVTFATLRAAKECARRDGVAVDWHAVVLPGDEAAVEPPVTTVTHLARTVQDVASLEPRRPLPIFQDVLALGSRDCAASHVIFSNMDIAVQPDFYTTLRDLITHRLGPDAPFTVARLNVDADLAERPLEELWAADGTRGSGHDCFVIPRALVERLDLGHCCLGAGHFDLLAYMQLDALSGGRAASIGDRRLTIHLGNDIAWASMMDYLEHNLRESLRAIERFKRVHSIEPGSAFARLDEGHFRRNATLRSALLRKLRRLPFLSSTILHLKRALGRQY